MFRSNLQVTLGGDLSDDWKWAFFCVAGIVLAVLVGLIPPITAAMEDGASLAWLGDAFVGLCAGLGAIAGGNFRKPRKKPVFGILRPNGIEVPEHSLLTWQEFTEIQSSKSGLFFGSGEFGSNNIYIPVERRHPQHRRALAFLKSQAPATLNLVQT